MEMIEVVTSRRIDAEGPDADGFYEFYYEYDLIHFVGETATLNARSYVDEPGDVSLMDIKQHASGEYEFLANDDFDSELVQIAITHLRGAGSKEITWLSPEDGYQPIPNRASPR